MSNLNEEEESTTNTKENTAKIGMSAWRKRHSLINANNPLLHRRLSQGKILLRKKSYSSAFNCI
jgi:hypothetical protein